MATGTMRVPLVAGLLLLAACAGHGARPGGSAPDPEQQAREAGAAYARGDIAQAETLYAAVAQARPDDADVWFRLGNARFRLQKPDDAVVAYDHAITLRPDFAMALYNIGVVRLKQAQTAMIASAQAGKPGDPLRRDSGRIAQRLAKAGDDVGSRAKGDGGAPPFIVDPDDATMPVASP